MSEPISVACPMCGASMTLKDRGKLGKKANCPNCSNLFVLAESAASPRPPAQNSSGQTAGQRIKAHQNKSVGGSKTGLLVGGGIVVVSLLVGVGLWASGLFSGGDNRPSNPPIAGGNAKNAPAQNKFNLAYLPADTELFVQLKLADAWEAPLLTQLAGLPQVQQGLQEVQQNLDLTPADVARLTIGLSGVSDQSQQAGETNPPDFASAAREKFIAVARLNKSVDANSLQLIEHGCKELQHGGKTYYLFQPPTDDSEEKTNEPLAVFLAEPKLIVLGSEQQVQAAIRTEGNQARRAELDFVDPDRQLLIVFVPKDKSALTDALPVGGGPADPAGEMALVAAKNLRALCIGINVGSDINLQLQANCTDDKAADDIKQLLDSLIVEARASLKPPSDDLFAAIIFAAVAEPLKSILSTVTTSVKSATVTVTANISETNIASLQPVVQSLTNRNGATPTEPDEPVEAPIPSGGIDSPDQ